MKIEDAILLSVKVEGVKFGEFCGGLRKRNVCPREGDKPAWGNIFKIVRRLETQGLICIIEEADSGNIAEIYFTEGGADRADALSIEERAAQAAANDQTRGLLAFIETRQAEQPE